MEALCHVRKILKGVGPQCAGTVLIRELGLQHVYSFMSAMRARAAAKYPTLSTVISMLSDSKKLGSIWARVAARWMARTGFVSFDTESVREAAEDQAWTSAMGTSKGAQEYYLHAYATTKHYCAPL